MKNLKLQSKIKFCLFLITTLSSISQISCSPFGGRISLRTPLTKEQYEQELQYAQNLQKETFFKSIGVALEAKLKQAWNAQQEKINQNQQEKNKLEEALKNQREKNRQATPVAKTIKKSVAKTSNSNPSPYQNTYGPGSGSGF